MSIRIKHEDDCFRPMILCDHCFKEITEAKSGNIEWVWDNALEAEGAEPLFFHKHCSYAYKKKCSDAPFRGWMELVQFPFYLVNNLNVEFKECERHAIRMAEILGA